MEGEGGRERGIRKEKLYLVLVSDKSPVMESRAVLRSTPLVSPMFRNRPPTVPRPPSPSLPSPPISTRHSDSGRAGKACILSGCRVSWTVTEE